MEEGPAVLTLWAHVEGVIRHGVLWVMSVAECVGPQLLLPRLPVTLSQP